MSGHNKWSTIKHKKAKTDGQRAKIFSKLAKEIIMAAKLGGGNPDDNSRLRLAVQKAKQANMPNDNVKRAILRGTGEGNEANLEEITFEAYGPYGVGLLIDTMTDNKNRTVPNLRQALQKFNGSLAAKGSVAYMFEKKGTFIFEPGCDSDKVMEAATENGADDIDIQDDGSVEVVTLPEQFEAVKQALDNDDITYLSGEVGMVPTTVVKLDIDQAKDVLGLVELLEDDDDVQEVYGNFEFPEGFFEEASA